MNRKHRRQYEMLLRVRDFARAHSQAFSESGAGRDTFAAVNAAVDELAATDQVKLEASFSARADRLAVARKGLTDLLLKVGQLARVLRAGGRTVPPFELPVSKSDQSLLTAARQFARDAAGLEAEFTRHGMGSAVISSVATAFETAMSDRGMKRADHVAASTRIHDLLTAALRDVRRLDLIVDNELASDNVISARWQQARRVGKGVRGAVAADAPLSPDEAREEAPGAPAAVEVPPLPSV